MRTSRTRIASRRMPHCRCAGYCGTISPRSASALRISSPNHSAKCVSPRSSASAFVPAAMVMNCSMKPRSSSLTPISSSVDDCASMVLNAWSACAYSFEKDANISRASSERWSSVTAFSRGADFGPLPFANRALPGDDGSHAQEERTRLARLRLHPHRARVRQRELADFEQTAAGAFGRLRVPDEAGLEDRLAHRFGDDRTVVHHEEEQQRLALVLHPADADHDLSAGRNVVQRVVHEHAERVDELVVILETFFEFRDVDLQLDIFQIGERAETIGDGVNEIDHTRSPCGRWCLFDFGRHLQRRENLIDGAGPIFEERIALGRTRGGQDRLAK